MLLKRKKIHLKINTFKNKYDRHLVEKELSREEKKADKNSENKNLIVAVYH